MYLKAYAELVNGLCSLSKYGKISVCLDDLTFNDMHSHTVCIPSDNAGTTVQSKCSFHSIALSNAYERSSIAVGLKLQLPVGNRKWETMALRSMLLEGLLCYFYS